jgi:tetratricopeptide (TPR) repeat protein
LVFAPLADAYRKEGDLKEAFAVCKKGLERHPAYTSARVVLGRIFQEQGKSEDAVSEFKKVLEVDSENLMAHSLLGSIYLSRGDYQTAIEEYQKILSLNPDDDNAQSSLRQAIEKAAGDSKPREAAKSPVESEPQGKENQATTSITLGELYLKQGHFDKAIEVFQELMTKDPQNLMIRQKLSDVMEKQQKEAALSGGPTSKLKKNEFTQPPDQKEDVITEEVKTDKRQIRSKKEDDSKFTSEDILQVMRRGSKDDAVVEEKKAPDAVKSPEPKSNNSPDKAPRQEEAKSTGQEKNSLPLKPEQIDRFKDILAELGTIEGIQRCFLIGNDGINIVSIGETSNNADLGKQAVAIFQSTHVSVSQLNQGNLQQVLVTADSGNILLVSLEQLVLIVLANDKINLGLLRITLDSVMKKMGKII